MAQNQLLQCRNFNWLQIYSQRRMFHQWYINKIQEYLRSFLESYTFNRCEKCYSLFIPMNNFQFKSGQTGSFSCHTKPEHVMIVWHLWVVIFQSVQLLLLLLLLVQWSKWNISVSGRILPPKVITYLQNTKVTINNLIIIILQKHQVEKDA